MIGTNDIFYSNGNEATKNYKKIIKHLTSELPNTKFYIQSVIPVNNDLASQWVDPKVIKNFNEEIAQIATENNLTYIDLFSLLANQKDELKREYTFDGIHLSGEGYMIWVNEIRSLITEQSNAYDSKK